MIKENSAVQSNFNMLCNDNIISSISKYYVVELLMIVFFILGFIFHKKYLRQDKANNNLKINNNDSNTDANTNTNTNTNDNYDSIRETLNVNFTMNLNDLNNDDQTNHKYINNTNNHSSNISEIMNSNEYNKECKYSDKAFIENNKKY